MTVRRVVWGWSGKLWWQEPWKRWTPLSVCTALRKWSRIASHACLQCWRQIAVVLVQCGRRGIGALSFPVIAIDLQFIGVVCERERLLAGKLIGIGVVFYSQMKRFVCRTDKLLDIGQWLVIDWRSVHFENLIADMQSNQIRVESELWYVNAWPFVLSFHQFITAFRPIECQFDATFATFRKCWNFDQLNWVRLFGERRSANELHLLLVTISAKQFGPLD